MIGKPELLREVRVEAEVLEMWIEAGWLVPRQEAGGHTFSDIDAARARLIRDLRHDMGINEEGVGVVLDLVDQVHGLRRVLRHLLGSLQSQPEATRHAIVAEIRTVLSVIPLGGPADEDADP